MKTLIRRTCLFSLLIVAFGCSNDRFNPKKSNTGVSLNTNYWRDTKGPPGADATAFLIDKHGDWWLGTGSSGGIYVSQDKGNSWLPANRGLGPVHIIALAKTNNSLLALVAVRDRHHTIPMESRMRASIGESMDVVNAAVYKFNFTTQKWKPYQIPVKKNKYRFAPWNQFQSWDYPYRGHPAYTNTTLPLYTFKITKRKLSDINARIILSHGGIYRLKKTLIKPFSNKGLQATDISKLVNTTHGLYAVVNHVDIWKWEKNTWSICYDGYIDGKRYGLQQESATKKISFGPESKINWNEIENPATRHMSVGPSRMILFIANGRIFSIKPNKQVTLLKNKGQTTVMYKGALNTHYLSWISAVEDTKGNLWCTAKIKLKQNSHFYNAIIKFSKKSKAPKIILLMKPSIYITYQLLHKMKLIDPYVLIDGLKNVWVAYHQTINKKTRFHLKLLSGNAPKMSHLIDNNYLLKEGRIATRKDGAIAILLGNDKIMMSYPGYKWYHRTADNLEGLNCLGFDDQGTLYAGTGFLHKGHGPCGAGPPLGYPARWYGHAQGVFKLLGGRWWKIPGEPNPKILSLLSIGNGTIAIGTSGSGLFILNPKNQ